jgi:murine toxin
MFWRCAWCGAINKAFRGSAEGLLKPGSFKAICPHCGTTTPKPKQAPEPTPLTLEAVDVSLAKEPTATHLISEDNSVEVLDTPRLWGEAFDEIGKSDAVSKAAGDLVERMGAILQGGRSVIDIVSLDAPGKDDLFEKAIFTGLRAAMKQTGGEVVIRILLGFVPVQGRFNEWKERLLTYLKGNVLGCKVPRLFLGQLYTVKGQMWNHAKIMAADGCQAIVGGHNLWWNSYGEHPPAHDISLHVRGRAAYDAQAFCEYLWNWGGWYLEAYQLEPGDKLATTSWTQLKTTEDEKPVRFFACFSCKEDDRRGIDKRVIFPPEVLVGKQAKPCKLGSKELLDSVEKRGDTARIMGLGRCAQVHLPSAASDLAKEAVIKGARRSLKLCQQDLVFSMGFGHDKHLVCRWIAKALLANGELQVEIVVSPQRAWAGGAPYSWGDGAIGAMKKIQQFLKALAPDEDRYEFAVKSLKIAPFCFTACDFESEADYAWPGLGNICVPFPIGAKVLATPANHCKFYIGDDNVCYVGSDNMYPNINGEFGYLVEGNAVDTILRNFWQPLWAFSSPHCVAPLDKL